MLSLLFKFQLSRLLRYFKNRLAAKLITVGLFFLVFLAVAVGLYLFFRQGFYYLNSDQYFREPITLYVYEIFFIIIGLIIVFNSFIFGLFGLFRGSDNNWLIGSPSFGLFPRYVFINAVLSSAWPLFIIVLPFLLATLTVYQLNIFSLVMIFLAVALLIIFLVGLMFSGLTLVAALIDGIHSKLHFFNLTYKKLLTVMILLIILVTWFIWQTSVNTDLISLFKAQDLSALNTDTVALISQQFHLLPTHLVALTIFSIQYNRLSQAWSDFFILLLITILVVTVFWLSSGRLFLNSWKKMQEGNFLAAANGNLNTARVKNSFHFRGGQVNTLFKKEILTAERDIKSILWFIFLLFIWLMQTGVNLVLARNIVSYQLNQLIWPAVIQVMQFVTAVYFISALVMRFVFPAFSSEKKVSWILASAPLNWSKIFWAKYGFYLSVLLGLGFIIGYSNLAILNIPWQMMGLSLLLFIVATIFIITLGLSFGAIFPNFETDDPAVLSTTLAGLGFIFLSCLYGAIGGWLLYTAITSVSVWLIIGFELISLIIIVWLLVKAPDALKNKDLVKIIE